MPTEDLIQKYSNDQWVNESFEANEDCTTGTYEINTYEFACWFDGETLRLNSDEDFNDVVLSIIDMQGRKVFKMKYSVLPGSIKTNSIPNGIYVVKLEGNAISGVQKVRK